MVLTCGLKPTSLGYGKISNVSGPPDPDSPYRCQAYLSRRRRRCQRWACRGRKYCQFHGGRRALARRHVLSNYFLGNFGPALRAKILELSKAPHHVQVSLHEELALTRAAADQAVRLAGAALDKGDAKTKDLAIQCMVDALGNVKEMALAVSKIERDIEDKVSLKVIDLFIMQIMKCIYSAVDEDVAQHIEQLINKNVRLPAPGMDPSRLIEGTLITPDQIVQDMDNTIDP